MDALEKKLELVQECLMLDDPRRPQDYIENLMTWELDDLLKYRDKRRMQQASLPQSPFRPHP